MDINEYNQGIGLASTSDLTNHDDLDGLPDRIRGSDAATSTAAATLAVSRRRLNQSYIASAEHPTKKIKLQENKAHATAQAHPPASAADTTVLSQTSNSFIPAATDSSRDAASTSFGRSNRKNDLLSATAGNKCVAASDTKESPKSHDSHEGSTVVTSSTDASHQAGESSSSSSRDSLDAGTALRCTVSPAASARSAAGPLKSITYDHLSAKYLSELEYMLREFRKLERQLLGAKGAAQLEESTGSRERREKLHSFILHLEDTVRQIELGCKLEVEGRSGVENSLSEPNPNSEVDVTRKQLANESALSKMTNDSEKEEENVQKLEEHILTNLLPVNVRLKKQLAAQQGATQNPAGMPHRRGSLQPPVASRGKGTFAEAAEKRRRQAESARLAAQEQHERTARRISVTTQLGRALTGSGSSLTRNLHGSTLGSSRLVHGHGVAVEAKADEAETGKTNSERKILYAGMVPGSTQQKSGLSAASGVHSMFTSQLDSFGSKSPASIQAHPAVAQKRSTPEPSVKAPMLVQAKPEGRHVESLLLNTKNLNSSLAVISKPRAAKFQEAIPDPKSPSLSEEERRKLRKGRRKRKLLRLARRQERIRRKQQNYVQPNPAGVQAPTKDVAAVRKKIVHGKSQKKKGPRSVEYICALCSEIYVFSCDYNPWWALTQHECPKCHKTQVSAFSRCWHFHKTGHKVESPDENLPIILDSSHRYHRTRKCN